MGSKKLNISIAEWIVGFPYPKNRKFLKELYLLFYDK